MRRIDELFTAWPFLGSRRVTEPLRAEGRSVNRKRVRRLMRNATFCGNRRRVTASGFRWALGNGRPYRDYVTPAVYLPP
jgi:hypothetical protein